MTRRVRLTTTALLTASALALSLSACTASAPELDPSPSAPSAPTAAPEPTPAATPAAIEDVPTPSPTPTEAPTCESIIAPSTIEVLADQGWTYREHPFLVGSEELAGGLSCVWGDYDVPSDNVQVFGWAPIGPGDANRAQQLLLADGWDRLDEDGHTYFTEDRSSVSIQTDDDGFGTTYEFGDGWVILADTRQSLALITRP